MPIRTHTPHIRLFSSPSHRPRETVVPPSSSKPSLFFPPLTSPRHPLKGMLPPLSIVDVSHYPTLKLGLSLPFFRVFQNHVIRAPTLLTPYKAELFPPLLQTRPTWTPIRTLPTFPTPSNDFGFNTYSPEPSLLSPSLPCPPSHLFFPCRFFCLINST